MHFGATLTEEYHWFPSQFCAPFPKYRACGDNYRPNGSELPSTYNQMGVMDAWSRKTLKRFEKFVRFLAKRPLAVKFAKFCSESFHRDTDRRVVCKIREIWPTGNRWHRAFLTWQKNFAWLPAVDTALIAPKIYHDREECSRFHPNRSTFGGI